MKRLLIIFTLIFLTSCGSKDDQGQAAGQCSNSKSEASLWIRNSDGFSFDLRGTEPETAYFMVLIDDGVCDELDGEFTFLYNKSTKTYVEGDCDGNPTATYDYNISCDNVLTLTDKDTGAKETFN